MISSRLLPLFSRFRFLSFSGMLMRSISASNSNEVLCLISVRLSSKTFLIVPLITLDNNLSRPVISPDLNSLLSLTIHALNN